MIVREGQTRYHIACPYCKNPALTGTFPGVTFPRTGGSFKAEAQETRLHCVACLSYFTQADAAYSEIVVEEDKEKAT